MHESTTIIDHPLLDIVVIRFTDDVKDVLYVNWAPLPYSWDRLSYELSTEELMADCPAAQSIRSDLYAICEEEEEPIADDEDLVVRYRAGLDQAGDLELPVEQLLADAGAVLLQPGCDGKVSAFCTKPMNLELNGFEEAVDLLRSHSTAIVEELGRLSGQLGRDSLQLCLLAVSAEQSGFPPEAGMVCSYARRVFRPGRDEWEMVVSVRGCFLDLEQTIDIRTWCDGGEILSHASALSAVEGEPTRLVRDTSILPEDIWSQEVAEQVKKWLADRYAELSS